MKTIKKLFILFMFLISNFIYANTLESNQKKIVYLTPDINIPFWNIMANGAKHTIESYGHSFEILSSNNSAKRELELTIEVIKKKVDGIIVSPTNSSACATILRLAKNANIPVVISDIGTDSGDYLSYISSNNKKGAYDIGKVLSKKMIENNWQDGSVGIIAIPQKRLNGQDRTAGFMEALNEFNIKGAGIKQLSNWTESETYNFTKEFIQNYPNLRAIWIQTSNIYKGAIKAINDMEKEKELFLVAFDAEPEFLKLIPEKKIIASGMQQPYLMGKISAHSIYKHLMKNKVIKDIQVPILTITTDNIKSKLPIIKQNVLGIK